METYSTLDELLNFSQNEKELTGKLLPEIGVKEKMESPSLQSVKNILDFSKAVSVRKSKLVENIEYLNN